MFPRASLSARSVDSTDGRSFTSLIKVCHSTTCSGIFVSSWALVRISPRFLPTILGLTILSCHTFFVILQHLIHQFRRDFPSCPKCDLFYTLIDHHPQPIQRPASHFLRFPQESGLLRLINSIITQLSWTEPAAVHGGLLQVRCHSKPGQVEDQIGLLCLSSQLISLSPVPGRRLDKTGLVPRPAGEPFRPTPL